MMLLADTAAAQTPEPEQGVIEEARRRRRIRRIRRAWVTVAALAVLAALSAGGIFGSRGHTPSRGADLRTSRAAATRSTETTCRSAIASSAAHSREAAARPGGAPIGRFPEAGWQRVLAAAHGPYTVMLLVGADGAAEFSCFSGRNPAEASLGGSLATHPPAPLPAGQIAIVSSGGGRVAPDEGTAEFSRLVGRTGAGVSSVVFRLSDGTRATATLAHGWFLAWWPGTQHVTATEVSSPGGTVLRPFGSRPRRTRGRTP